MVHMSIRILRERMEYEPILITGYHEIASTNVFPLTYGKEL